MLFRINKKYISNLYYLNIYNNNKALKYLIKKEHSLNDLENLVREDNLVKYSIDFYDLEPSENNYKIKEMENKEMNALEYFKYNGGIIKIDNINTDFDFGVYYKDKNGIYLNKENDFIQNLFKKYLNFELFDMYNNNNNEKISKEKLTNILDNNLNKLYGLISNEKNLILKNLDKLNLFYNYYLDKNTEINEENERKSIKSIRALWFLLLLLNMYLFYLTYMVHGWDTIEPVAYLIAWFFEIVGIYMFLKYKKFPSNKTFFDYFLKKCEKKNPKFKNILNSIDKEIKKNEDLLKLIK